MIDGHQDRSKHGALSSAKGRLSGLRHGNQTAAQTFQMKEVQAKWHGVHKKTTESRVFWGNVLAWLASTATLSALLQHLMDFWKPSGQQREPQWRLPNQEPAVHLPKPQKKIPQIDVSTSGDPQNHLGMQLPTTDTNA